MRLDGNLSDERYRAAALLVPGRRWRHANVQNIAASHDQASKVCGWVTPAEFPCSIKDYVHVTVAVEHLSPIFSVVFQFH